VGEQFVAFGQQLNLLAPYCLEPLTHAAQLTQAHARIDRHPAIVRAGIVSVSQYADVAVWRG
jgi:hypothetical protein